MEAYRHSTLHPNHPSSRSMPFVFLPVGQASTALHAGAPYTLQPSHPTSQPTASIPPALTSVELRITPTQQCTQAHLFSYTGYNSNWGSEVSQNSDLLRLALIDV
ncbi:hypothetical protein JVU11DRAFT_7598 [Chiua virens]|nr:hypothetical protein JVU11DRAFT_7598 [Chiua virens]